MKITSIFPNDINTDDIIRADILQESTTKHFFAQYAFEKYDKDFIKRCSKAEDNVIIAWENFGCGSSREQAVYALKYNNVKAVIAKSYPDIFYRNSINNWLVLIRFDKIEEFNLWDEIEIDLENKKIIKTSKDKKSFVSTKQEYDFQISDDDKFILEAGWQLWVVKNYINDKNIFVKKCRENSWIVSSEQTMVEKIISNHIWEKVFAWDKVSALPIDLVYINEVIGPASIVYYNNDFWLDQKVADPKSIFFIPDHTIPSSSIQVSKWIDLMKDFAKKQGFEMFKQWRWIEHIVWIEEWYIVPGSIILWTDSHTCTNWALNTFSLWVWTTDAEYSMASKAIFNFTVPKSIKVELTWELQKWVYAKDVVLKLLQMLWADWASKMVMEFCWDWLKNLEMDGRTTISNMAVEMSARTAIFPYDEIVEKNIPSNPKYNINPVFADENANYEKIIKLDLSELEPMVAFPHKPANACGISEIKNQVENSKSINSADFPAITLEDLNINQAFLGACTNGKYDDLVEAAKVLKWNKVHNEVTFVVIPASSEIYKKALKNWIIEIFIEAWCLVESPNCGTCFWKHMWVTSDKTRIISTSNRNYKWRMWDPETLIFLASPAVVSASAIEWKICDPRKYL